jgi:hypothetical protein
MSIYIPGGGGAYRYMMVPESKWMLSEGSKLRRPLHYLFALQPPDCYPWRSRIPAITVRWYFRTCRMELKNNICECSWNTESTKTSKNGHIHHAVSPYPKRQLSTKFHIMIIPRAALSSPVVLNQQHPHPLMSIPLAQTPLCP